MVYIGVDLHRKKSQVAAMDQDGKLGLVADLLAELGIPAHMAHPSATKALRAVPTIARCDCRAEEDLVIGSALNCRLDGRSRALPCLAIPVEDY